MSNRQVQSPGNDPADGASRVAAELLRGLLDSERTLRQLAESAASVARNALIGLGQDLLGDFEEVHKTQLPVMSEENIRKLICQRVQQKTTEQIAAAVKQVPASKAASVPAAVRDVPARRLPVASAPALPSPPPEPPAMDDWVLAPPASVAVAPTPAAGQPAVSLLESASPIPAADDDAEDAGAVLELADFVPYTSDFTPAAPSATWPAWFSEWMSQRDTDGFAKDFTILQILGRTGEPYRSVVAHTAAAQLDLQSGRSGTVGRSIDRLIELDWLTREEVQWQSTKLHLLALTVQGLDAYRLLWGQPPAAQVLSQMLARHKSAPHVHLILETQRILEDAGYTVERFPTGSETANGMVYPDLVAEFEGRTLHIEVEVKTAKSGPDRQAKWQRYWELTHGQFYLVTANKRGTSSLLSELRFWALNNHQLLDIYLLEVARAAGSGWDIWQHFTI